MRPLLHTHRAPFATLRRSVVSTRRAFTLIELLVVISIILVVAAITLSAVNLSITGDRIRGAGRQVQSYLEGARGRAVYGGNASSKGSGYQTGVRFIPELESWQPSTIYQNGASVLPRNNGTGFVYRVTGGGGGTSSAIEPDPWPTIVGKRVNDNGIIWTCVTDPILCNSIQFVEVDPTNAAITGGVFSIHYDTNGSPTRLIGTPEEDASGNPNPAPEASFTRWYAASEQKLFSRGQVILLNNRKYQIDQIYMSEMLEIIDLTSAYVGTLRYPYTGVADETAVPRGSEPEYKILLPPQPMANQEVRSLGNGVVFDLSLSKGMSYLQINPQRIDVMFSPRGMVVGPITSSGLVQFVVSDREDSLNRVPLSWRKWEANPQPNGTYDLGDGVIATTGQANLVFVNLSGTGAPGSTEPTWNTTLGATTSDGGVTWTCVVPKRERNIVSLTPLTGKTSVHPVYLDPAGLVDDPFRYSETGEVARQ